MLEQVAMEFRTKTFKITNYSTHRWILGLFLILVPILPRHPTDTRRTEFIIGWIDHVRRTEPFVAGFLPFGNQGRVHQFLVQTVLIDGSIDPLVRIVKIVNIATFLPIDLVHGPHGFRLAFVQVRFLDLVAQLVLEGLENGFDRIKTSRRLALFLVPFGRERHDGIVSVLSFGNQSSKVGHSHTTIFSRSSSVFFVVVPPLLVFW